MLEHSITCRHYEATYYQNLEEVMWLFRLEKPNKGFEKTSKNLNKFYKKNLQKIVILKS